MSILKQIKSNKYTYNLSNLTLESFKQVIKDISFQPIKQEITIFTGYLGAFIFDLAIRGLNESELPKYFLYRPKRSKIVAVFNLYKKHGNFKILLYHNNTLDLRYGTTSLGIFNKFKDCINKLKELKLIYEKTKN
jgi:hypothetical protein